MVRQWKDGLIGYEGGAGIGIGPILIVWAACISICFISFIVFACSDGASKDKSSAVDSHIHGGGCAGGCGASCGG